MSAAAPLAPLRSSRPAPQSGGEGSREIGSCESERHNSRFSGTARDQRGSQAQAPAEIAVRPENQAQQPGRLGGQSPPA